MNPAWTALLVCIVIVIFFVVILIKDAQNKLVVTHKELMAAYRHDSRCSYNFYCARYQSDFVPLDGEIVFLDAPWQCGYCCKNHETVWVSPEMLRQLKASREGAK